MNHDQSSLHPAKRRPRHVRTPDNLEPIRLTRRDLEILHAVGDNRILSTGQIKRLYFRSIHKTRKRLFKLWQHQMLDRRFQPIRFGESPSETLYVLARKGTRVMASQNGSHEQTPLFAPFERAGSPLFLEHTLARNDFRISLETAMRGRNDSWSFRWRHDKGIARSVVIISGNSSPRAQRVALIADGLFQMRIGQSEREFYLEVDRGTVSLTRWKTRILAYATLARSRDSQSPAPAFCVLITTPSMSRASHLGNVVQAFRLPQRFLFFATTKQLVDENQDGLVDAKIWRRLSSSKFEIVETVSIVDLVQNGNSLRLGLPSTRMTS